MLWLLQILSLALVALASPPSYHGGGAYFYKGHDLSSLPILVEGGAIYKDGQHGNITKCAEDILGAGGMNTVRLRIWVNPPDGNYNLEYNIKFASQLVKKGYKIYLDFHFSDTWADPQHQLVPVAWLDPATNTTTVAALEVKIREYVADTLLAFHKAGIKLDLVSLGNEIRHGTLWPYAQADVDREPFSSVIANFTNLAHIYASARRGVTDAVSKGAEKPTVMIHIDNGWNLTLQERWFGAITAEGIVTTKDWDVFGFSFYPFYGAAATFDNLYHSLHTLAAKYHKPIMVVETDFPATGCTGGVYQNETFPAFFSEPELVPLGVQGQLDWMAEITKIVRSLPNGLGQGTFYWEPAWLNSTSLGGACPDSLLFDQDWSDLAHPVGISRKSVEMFRH
ncbi:glycosyl hydrolase 53 [Rhizodiscina lignyota]|uniref:Arabinogalactan endo-beta-1,4-galactanase n=1 Tax=Rhizodiscina lignyota TaxID=1504668 RepID=A0A9P4M975_9PEZI|nr:glycosyl hydrolase 53 [Rhizodiscina lignyota]